MDLKKLEYPRHVHRGGDSRIVTSADAAADAVKDGWALVPQPDHPLIASDGSVLVDTVDLSAPIVDEPAPAVIPSPVGKSSRWRKTH